jgi:hypothetical protein
MTPFPSFDPQEVELLIEAVQQTLEHLRQGNERLGGNDREMLETGRRYAVVLQSLKLSKASEQLPIGHDGRKRTRQVGSGGSPTLPAK